MGGSREGDRGGQKSVQKGSASVVRLKCLEGGLPLDQWLCNRRHLVSREWDKRSGGVRGQSQRPCVPNGGGGRPTAAGRLTDRI